MYIEKERLTRRIAEMEERYLSFWEAICNRETPSRDKAALDGLVGFIEDFARKEGFMTRRIPMADCGDFLLVDWNEGKEKKSFFLAHMDTVHQKGKFGNPPVRIEGDRMIGPGVIDCKGGIAVALCVMKALKEEGYPYHLRLMLTSDEEESNLLGGQRELDFIRESCQGFAAALNCEVGREGAVVVSRCGILRERITVEGVSAHSGIAYFEGASAIREAAYKILSLEEKSRKGGTTYNCALVEGGSHQLNIVPDRCSFCVDVRVATVEAMEEAEAFVKKTVEHCTVPGTRATVERISRRLPMVENEGTRWLLEKVNRVCRDNGFGELEKEYSGGGSDSAYTQAAGVPSLCALGTVGDGCHTDKEYARISSMKERALLLSLVTVTL